jgi:hypothetical protein
MKCNPEGAENASPQVTALTAGTLSGHAIGRLALLLRSGDKRGAEILALRHQILVLQTTDRSPRVHPD